MFRGGVPGAHYPIRCPGAETNPRDRPCASSAVTRPLFLPEPDAFALGPDDFLEQVRSIKKAVRVPVIGSLNGVSLGGWLEHARLIEQAGADAPELNVYMVAADSGESAEAIEDRTVEMVRTVRADVRIPLAVKLSPFYTALAHFAGRLDEVGPAGLVLFNRSYQPGIDVEALEVRRELHLSDSSELPLRLRWLAILPSTCGRRSRSPAASTPWPT